MADSECLFWDGDDEEPPAYVERHTDIVMILHMLDQTCRNEDPAWCLDHALLCIGNGRRAQPVLDQDDRDEILRRLTRVKSLIPEFIPNYPPEQFTVGLDAAMTQVIIWAETPEERASRHPDTKLDADDVAHCLRNDMYNWCLIDRVRARRYARQAETISAIILPFRQAGVLG